MSTRATPQVDYGVGWIEQRWCVPARSGDDLPWPWVVRRPDGARSWTEPRLT